MISIIPRAEWGARHEDGFGAAPLPASEVWLHHSVTIAPDLVPPFDDEFRAMRTLEDIGEQRFGRGISYTFAIMPTGRIYEGHGVARQGAHTAMRNSIARAIVFVGNYDATPPTRQMVSAAGALLAHGKQQGWWKSAQFNGGHQQAPGASTACPGKHGMAAIPEINKIAAMPPTEDLEAVMRDVASLRFITSPRNPNAWYVTDGMTKRGVSSQDEANILLQLGLVEMHDEATKQTVAVIPDHILDAIPLLGG